MNLDLTKPPKLYRYSELQWLERSLRFGEFRLRPAADYKQIEVDVARQDDELVRISTSPGELVTITWCTGKKINPIGDVTYRSEVGTNYLTICFSQRWDELLFSDFPGTDTCLVVHDVHEFCERMHACAEITLPDWAGLDAKVVYGGSSPLGAMFSKPVDFILQHEWRFAWRPPEIAHRLEPITLKIGSIEKIAELVQRPHHTHNHA